jgi:hypothetical protein
VIFAVKICVTTCGTARNNKQQQEKANRFNLHSFRLFIINHPQNYKKIPTWRFFGSQKAKYCLRSAGFFLAGNNDFQLVN